MKHFVKIHPIPNKEKNCSVIYCENDDLCNLSCSHYICNSCKEGLIGNNIKNQKFINCPLCRKIYIIKDTNIYNNETIINVLETNDEVNKCKCLNLCLILFWTKLGLQVMLLIGCYSLISFLILYLLCQNEKDFKCIQCLIMSFSGPFIVGYPILYIFIENLQNYKHKKKINILWSFLFSIVMFILIGTAENCEIKYYLLWTPVIWFVCFFWCIYNFTKN